MASLPLCSEKQIKSKKISYRFKKGKETMKRKVISLLLCLALALALVPATALAIEPPGAPGKTIDVGSADTLVSVARVLEMGSVADDETDPLNVIPGEPTQEQIDAVAALGYESSDKDSYNAAFDEIQHCTLNITADLEMPENFPGIGTSLHPFCGSVSGNGHTIHVSFDAVGENSVLALFAYMSTEDGELTICDLTVTGKVAVRGEATTIAAGLIGDGAGANPLHVVNCVNDADVTNTTYRNADVYFTASGLAGHIANADIVDCCNTGAISVIPAADAENPGYFHGRTAGIVSQCDSGSIVNCVNNGTLYFDIAAYRQAGGILATGGAVSIIGCINNGSIIGNNTVENSAQQGKAYVGGIAGSDDSLIAVTDCVNNGDITINSRKFAGDMNWSHHMIGGLGGQARTTYTNCVNNGDVTVNKESGGAAIVGGIVGGQQSGNYVFIDCVNNGAVTVNLPATGTVAGNVYVSGILGINKDNLICRDTTNNGALTVNDYGSLSRTIYIGGFLASNDGGGPNLHETSVKENFVNMGAMTANVYSPSTVNIGGISANLDCATVRDSYVKADITVNRYNNSGATNVYAAAKTKGTPILSNIAAMTDVAYHVGSGYTNTNSTFYVLTGDNALELSNMAAYVKNIDGFNTVKYFESNKPFINSILYTEDELTGVKDEIMIARLRGGAFNEYRLLTADRLEIPEKDGYRFSGWMTQNTPGKFSNDDTLAENFESGIYYARWTCEEHLWRNSWITDQTASASQEGIRHKECAKCDSIVTQTLPTETDGHTHAFEEGTESDESTCTAYGMMTYPCTEEGCTEPVAACKETIAPDGYIFDDGIVLAEPDCCKHGMIQYSAVNSEYSYYQFLPALNDRNGHVWAENRSSNYLAANSSYDVPTTYYKSCSICGAQGDETFTVGETWKHVDSIAIAPSEAEIIVGYTTTLRADILPLDAHDKSFIWTSSDPTVATVSDSGIVTAVSEGAATITAVAADGEVSGCCAVTVVKKPVEVHTEIKTVEIEKEKIVEVEKVKTVINLFHDVNEKDYFYDAVIWAQQNGISNGIDATHFAPNKAASRAEVVAFLWRAAGCPEPSAGVSKFADVHESAYYAKAVSWAVEHGITYGTSDTMFSPDITCTRGQIVTFLARLAGVKDTETESVFSDVKSTDYFAAAVKWAKDNGITMGTTATTFSPNADCTRGQIVTFLYRSDSRIARDKPN